VTRSTAVPDASSASGRYGTGSPLENIANAGHIGRRRRRVKGRGDRDGLVGGRRVDDIVEELGGSGAGSLSVPASRLVDLRHELTALIKSELYGGGNKTEGRAALIARRELDKFFFDTEQSQLTRGNVADLDALKRAIILKRLPSRSRFWSRPVTQGAAPEKVSRRRC
jgi:hypothetical protein